MQILLFVFVAFMPFQDIGLSSTPLGYAGASLSLIPLLAILAIQIAKWILQKQHNINKLYIASVLYMLGVTLVYFASAGLESHGENLIFKSVKLFILTILFVYPIFFINYEKAPHIKYAVAAAFTISLAGMLLPQLGFDWLDSNSMLHATENGNMRSRGFALESSTLSIQIVTLGLLTMHFFTNRLTRGLLLVAITTSLAIMHSKGGIAATGLTVFCSMLLLRKIAKWKKTLAIIVGLLIALSSLYLVLDSVTTDWEEYSSTATRLTMVITAILIAAHNPFGVGFSGYLSAINAYLPEAIDLFNLPLNYSEVSAYIAQDSGKGISAKTFLFSYLMYFGWPFVIGFVLFFVELIRRIRRVGSLPLLAAVLFSFFAICTYSDGIGLYNVSLVFGVAFSEAFRKNKFGNYNRWLHHANYGEMGGLGHSVG